MELVTPRNGSRLWLLLAIAMAGIVAGVLSLAQDRAAEAGLTGTPPEQDVFVVISGGVVNITIQALDDDGLDVFVSGGGFPAVADITHVSCSFDISGSPCDAGQPVVCEVGISTGDPCIQYLNEGVDGNGDQDAYTIVVQVTLECDLGQTGPPITIGEFDGDVVDQESLEFLDVFCVPPDEPGAFFITKEFDGDPEQEFEFTLTTDASICGVSVEGSPLEAGVVSGDTFALAHGETALIFCLDPEASQWTLTVTETDPGADVATLTAIDCGESDAVEDLETASASLMVANLGDQTLEGTGTCTFTNTAADGGDDPEIPNIIVAKECVGVEGTFTIVAGEESQEVACGETVTFADLEPGTYTIEEVLDGDETATGGGCDTCDTCGGTCDTCGICDTCGTCDTCGGTCEACDGSCDPEDGSGIATMIACSDLQQVEGTSVTVELVDTDIFCVFINSAEDLHGLVCGCLSVDIEIDNTNTNVIGIENANANDNANTNDNDNENENTNENDNNNENTNTQDQDNAQDQDNENEQKNNITSSPEVNLDFD